MTGGRVLAWAIGLLLFLDGSAWPILKDEMSLPRSTPNEETDDVEIDKILISADITVSQSRKQALPNVDETWPSSGEVDEKPFTRTDQLVVPLNTGPNAAHPNKGTTVVPTERSDRPAASGSDPIAAADTAPPPSELPYALAPRQSNNMFQHGIDPAMGINLPPDSAAAESVSETTEGQPLPAKEDAGDRDGQDSFEDETDSPLEQAREKLPTALQNLPRDIPNDRTISEILAENTIQDKQYNELRIEELLDELMAHTLGFGEVYSSDIE